MEAMQVSLQTESGLGFMGVFFREVRPLKSGCSGTKKRVPSAAPGLCSHHPVPQKTLGGLELQEERQERVGLLVFRS